MRTPFTIALSVAAVHLSSLGHVGAQEREIGGVRERPQILDLSELNPPTQTAKPSHVKRIVGGYDIPYAPFMAGLMYFLPHEIADPYFLAKERTVGPFTTNNYYDLECGGTLIDSRHVITAAHCIDEFYLENGGVSYDMNKKVFRPTHLVAQQQILTGTASLTQEFGNAGHRTEIEKVSVHPKFGSYAKLQGKGQCYDSRGFFADCKLPQLDDPELYDVAVLTLKDSIDTDLGGIRLVEQGSSEYVQPNREVRILGWGKKYYPVGNKRVLYQAEILQEGQMQLIAAGTKGLNPSYVKQNHLDDPSVSALLLLAGVLKTDKTGVVSVGGGIDACAGDSGGPLLATDVDGKPVLIGITSFGPPRCGAAGHPGAYTNLAHPEINEFVRSALGG